MAGLKSEDTVGAAFYTNGLVGTYSLPKECSIFSAEAYAIKMAVSIPNVGKEIAILTDSASCLQALEAGTSKHPWIQEIEHIARNKSIRFCWIPGHAGVNGNTEADRLANEARRQNPIDTPIPGEDILRAVKQAIRCRWSTQWYGRREAKLRQVKHDTYRWKDHGSAADQRVLTRVRIGHTRLTHMFLLKKEPPPSCECCGTLLDVQHLILQCRKYDNERRENNIDSTSLRSALNNEEETIKNILKFFHDTGLYSKL